VQKKKKPKPAHQPRKKNFFNWQGSKGGLTWGGGVLKKKKKTSFGKNGNHPRIHSANGVWKKNEKEKIQQGKRKNAKKPRKVKPNVYARCLTPQKVHKPRGTKLGGGSPRFFFSQGRSIFGDISYRRGKHKQSEPKFGGTMPKKVGGEKTGPVQFPVNR